MCVHVSLPSHGNPQQDRSHHTRHGSVAHLPDLPSDPTLDFSTVLLRSQFPKGQPLCCAHNFLTCKTIPCIPHNGCCSAVLGSNVLPLHPEDEPGYSGTGGSSCPAPGKTRVYWGLSQLLQGYLQQYYLLSSVFLVISSGVMLTKTAAGTSNALYSAGDRTERILKKTTSVPLLCLLV